jgi:anti-anti-sigma factor
MAMMTVTTRSLDAEKGVGQIVVAGDATDALGLQRLRRALFATADQYRELVVDLSSVTDISAATLAGIVEAAVELRWQGGDLAVVAIGPLADRLAAAGLSAVLKVCPDADSALAELAPD